MNVCVLEYSSQEERVLTLMFMLFMLLAVLVLLLLLPPLPVGKKKKKKPGVLQLPRCPCFSQDPQGLPRIQLKSYQLAYQGCPESCSCLSVFKAKKIFFKYYLRLWRCSPRIYICSNSCIELCRTHSS